MNDVRKRLWEVLDFVRPDSDENWEEICEILAEVEVVLDDYYKAHDAVNEGLQKIKEYRDEQQSNPS